MSNLRSMLWWMLVGAIFIGGSASWVRILADGTTHRAHPVYVVVVLSAGALVGMLIWLACYSHDREQDTTDVGLDILERD